MVALMATFSSFGQQILKWNKVTNYMSTSEMVWSAIDKQTLFFDNTPMSHYKHSLQPFSHRYALQL